MAKGINRGIRSRTLAALAATAALSAWAPRCPAQLREEQVLVVYDSRIADSRSVAEYYAGSKKVPGGVGGLPGVHRGVRVLDLASTGAAVTAPGNISFTDFVSRIRDPIRAHMTANGLTTRVRALVTTKGLPHRVQDSDVPNAADFPGNNPGQFIPELTSNDATSASVEAELALLWQNLTTGELGGSSDSKADGCIFNPFWKQTKPINTQNNANVTAVKTFTASGIGPLWTGLTSGTTAARFVPGDVYLACRLDGRSVATVQSVINRAQNLYLAMTASAVLLDEDGADLDNINGTFPTLRAGDDYEQTQAALIADRRLSAANVRYDNAAGAANFFVGPRLSFTAGHGILISTNVILLATYGSNHSGVPTLSAGGSAATVYATSFNYAPGAIFNTIESYNGRDFGGLGQLSFAMQQQAADFFEAGGTFAVTNVWEPLADPIPDNLYLTTNFVLGNLSWGEAAYSSIPALSWMQMPLGDPLARMTRSTEDTTVDARVQTDDLYRWEQLPSNDPLKDVDKSGVATTTDRNFIADSARAAERNGLLNGRL